MMMMTPSLTELKTAAPLGTLEGLFSDGLVLMYLRKALSTPSLIATNYLRSVYGERTLIEQESCPRLVFGALLEGNGSASPSVP